MMSTLVHGSEPAVKTDVFSTRQVAQLLGVGEATVKRWADAGEIDCFRTPGGHRKFRLGDEAVAAVEKSALAGDASSLVAQMAALRLRGHGLAAIFDDVVAPALQRIGHRWEACKLSVADEHVATQAVVDAIARAQPLAEPPGEPNRSGRGTAVVAGSPASSTTWRRGWPRACCGPAGSRCSRRWRRRPPPTWRTWCSAAARSWSRSLPPCCPKGALCRTRSTWRPGPLAGAADGWSSGGRAWRGSRSPRTCSSCGACASWSSRSRRWGAAAPPHAPDFARAGVV